MELVVELLGWCGVAGGQILGLSRKQQVVKCEREACRNHGGNQEHKQKR